MTGILLADDQQGKSSRGTPRLRRVPGNLHGALRLAVPPESLSPWLWLCADVVGASTGVTFLPQPYGLGYICLKRDALSSRRLWRLPRVFGLAGAHAGPDLIHPVCFRGIHCGLEQLNRARRLLPTSPPLGCSIHADRRTSCWSNRHRRF